VELAKITVGLNNELDCEKTAEHSMEQEQLGRQICKSISPLKK